MRRRPLVDATALGVIAPVALAAHHVADYIVQTHNQACAKGRPGRDGQLACLRHVASYTATQLVAVTGAAAVSGLRLRPAAVLAGVAVSAATHYWADRREPLRRLAEATGRGEFYRLGAPREGCDDNPTLGTGAHAIDQAWHKGWLLVASALMAAGAGRR